MRNFFFLIIYFSNTLISFSQKLDKNKSYFISAIGFWNVENLYDTVKDRWANDEEFTPFGVNAWTGDRYRKKICHLAEVISQLATEVTPEGVAVMGLCEIENKNAVQDLVNDPQLKKRNYQIIHIEGPDARGVDPSFIYNPIYFKPSKAIAYKVKLAVDSNHKTRDILLITGTFLNDPIAFLINHWPSRRGGEMISRPNRNSAARIARRIADSVSHDDPKTKIIIMGDLNDDPVNESVKKYIGTVDETESLNENNFFNPMEKLYKDGIGTLAWGDSWNLFDQIILNHNWIGKFESWNFYKAKVFNKAFVKSDFGNFKGYPFRTYGGGAYTGGYSDHFAVYILIAKEKK